MSSLKELHLELFKTKEYQDWGKIASPPELLDFFTEKIPDLDDSLTLKIGDWLISPYSGGEWSTTVEKVVALVRKILSSPRPEKSVSFAEKALLNPALANLLYAYFEPKDYPDISPVHLAAASGDLKQFDACYLIHDINQETPHLKLTALDLACANKNAYFVKKILYEEGLDLSKNPYLIHLIAAQSSLEILKLVLAKLDPSILNAKDGLGLTPLQYAIIHNNEPIVRHLFTLDGVEKIPRDRLNNTPLHLAAKHSTWSLFTFLLSKKIYDVNAGNLNGETALHLACASGIDALKKVKNISSVKGLLFTRLDSNENSPFHFAAACGNLPVFQYLFEKHEHFGIEPNGANLQDDLPINLAAKNNQIDFVMQILESDKYLDLYVINEEGITPLHDACKQGHLELCKKLLDYSQVSEFFTTDTEKLCPIGLALKNGHMDLVRQFSERKYPIKAEYILRLVDLWIDESDRSNKNGAGIEFLLLERLKSPNCYDTEYHAQAFCRAFEKCCLPLLMLFLKHSDVKELKAFIKNNPNAGILHSQLLIYSVKNVLTQENLDQLLTVLETFFLTEQVLYNDDATMALSDTLLNSGFSYFERLKHPLFYFFGKNHTIVSLLDKAVQRRHESFLHFFFDHFSDFKSNLGIEKVHLAALLGDAAFLKEAFKTNSSLFHLKDWIDRTPLHFAAMHGKNRELFALFPDLKQLAQIKDRHNCSFADYLFQSGELDTIEYFMRDQTVQSLPRLLPYYILNSRNPLDYFEFLKKFPEHHLDFNLTTNNSTPFSFAAGKSSSETITYLIENHAQLNIPFITLFSGEGENPLLQFLYKERAEPLAYILKKRRVLLSALKLEPAILSAKISLPIKTVFLEAFDDFFEQRPLEPWELIQDLSILLQTMEIPEFWEDLPNSYHYKQTITKQLMHLTRTLADPSFFEQFPLDPAKLQNASREDLTALREIYKRHEKNLLGIIKVYLDFHQNSVKELERAYFASGLATVRDALLEIERGFKDQTSALSLEEYIANFDSSDITMALFDTVFPKELNMDDFINAFPEYQYFQCAGLTCGKDLRSIGFLPDPFHYLFELQEGRIEGNDAALRASVMRYQEIYKQLPEGLQKKMSTYAEALEGFLKMETINYSYLKATLTELYLIQLKHFLNQKSELFSQIFGKNAFELCDALKNSPLSLAQLYDLKSI